MKYEITKEQVEFIITNIQEAPARFVVDAMVLLRQLKVIEEKKEPDAIKQ